MKYDLKPFQLTALNEMLEEAEDAHRRYEKTGKPQVISLTAPTGAGKTIIATSFIEDTFMGNETHLERPDSIFVWLSDSPELNEQSKNKIEATANKLKLGQCVTIDADSFNQEFLEEGYIYFLNTQKLSKTSRLVKGGDGRDFTIWETFQNTIEEKSEKLYVIIDEAHRGMKDKGAKEATTTMQKFIKGSKADGLSPFPVVIGMSATSERFTALVGNVSSTIRPVIITPAAVRRSGLLKDEVVVLYPKDITARVDMAVLQAATDDWKKKCDHWEIFYDKQKTKRVNPVFLIQVQNGTGGKVTETDLDEVIRTIEDRIGYTFNDDEIVHAFGEKSTLTVNGRTVRYEEPSRIEENKAVKVVLFKESLSTGWDCPRAETMMSLRNANDATYIAQLLGRMLRNPLQQKIMTDEYLNSVYLFLPYFKQATVDRIIKELKDDQGGSLPTNIESSEIGETSTLTAMPKKPKKPSSSPKKPVSPPLAPLSGSISIEDIDTPSPVPEPEPVKQPEIEQDNPVPQESFVPKTDPFPEQPEIIEPEPEEPEEREEEMADEIDRLGIIAYINNLGIQSYEVRKDKINDYLKSLFQLAGFLHQTSLYAKAVEDIKTEIACMIHDFIDGLRAAGTYDAMSKKLLEFALSAQAFDVFGDALPNDVQVNLFTTDTDIDRQFAASEKKLKNEGVGIKYGQLYADPSDINEYKIDVIMFVNDTNCMSNLVKYAEKKYHDLIDIYRSRIKTLPDQSRARYRRIVNDGDAVSSHDFYLPQAIDKYPSSSSGMVYTDHLYVDEETRGVQIKLNTWEEGVLEEEAKRNDFICWLRNPDRRSWSLCIPYEKDGHNESMYPDFIVIRKDGPHDYFVDILEPHDPSRTDNVGKAKGLAKYAETNYDFGRIQLIRKSKKPTGEDGFIRLDMSKSEVRSRMKGIITNDELDHVFNDYGFFD